MLHMMPVIIGSVTANAQLKSVADWEVAVASLGPLYYSIETIAQDDVVYRICEYEILTRRDNTISKTRRKRIFCGTGVSWGFPVTSEDAGTWQPRLNIPQSHLEILRVKLAKHPAT